MCLGVEPSTTILNDNNGLRCRSASNSAAVAHLDIHPREEHRVRDLVQGLATETDTPEAVMASIYRAFALEHAEVYARMSGDTTNCPPVDMRN